MIGTGKTILVLGGGVGGVMAARELRKRLPAVHRVVLIERSGAFTFAPSYLWVLTGERSGASISRPLSRLARRGIEVVRGSILRIDAGRRVVEVDGRAVPGDYLVVALGAEFAPETIPGLAGSGDSLYDLEGAERLRGRLASLRSGRLAILTSAPAYRCPAAPYEAAMLIEALLRKRRVRDQVKLDFYAAEPGPMGVAGPEVSRAVRGMIEARGIQYHPEHQIKAVDPGRRILNFENGASAEFDHLVFVPPHRAPKVARESGLVAAGGWMQVDRHTLATPYEHVFAIGDVVSIPLTMGKPLPKAGVFAHAQAIVVAKNIAREITGRGVAASFGGHGECFVEAGDGRAGFGKGNFYAEPAPEVRLYPPSWWWHVGKVVLEQYWLRRVF
ncbi:MAG TPA: FAD/NAD(P)-binding oxidoreductase [Candidatus Eisenbacteria bacterium]|jgi:sulfide:quinone oxidoreductase